MISVEFAFLSELGLATLATDVAVVAALNHSGYDSMDSFDGMQKDEIKAELEKAGMKPGHVNKIAAGITKRIAQPPQVPGGIGTAGNESL